MKAQIRWSHMVISTTQYVWVRLGLAGNGHRKIGDTETVEGEGHSGEVEVSISGPIAQRFSSSLARYSLTIILEFLL